MPDFIMVWNLVLGYAFNTQTSQIPFPTFLPFSTSVFPLHGPRCGYLWVTSCCFGIGYRDLDFGIKSSFLTCSRIASCKLLSLYPKGGGGKDSFFPKNFDR